MSNVNGDNWTNVTTIRFSQYYILMYYASLISEIEGLKLMNASLTEESCNNQNGLPVKNTDNNMAFYVPNQLQDVINFLNNQVLPALQNEQEETDLVMDIYGGIDNFIDRWYSGAAYLKNFNVFEDEIEPEFSGYVPNIIDTAVTVRDFFKSSINQNESYEILVE